MVTYIPSQRGGVGTFVTGPDDSRDAIVVAVQSARDEKDPVLFGRIGFPTYSQKAGYVTPKPVRAGRPGDGTVKHNQTVAQAVAMCEAAGVEFWALAPARGGTAVWAVRDEDGVRGYVLVTRSRGSDFVHVDAVRADGTPRSVAAPVATAA